MNGHKAGPKNSPIFIVGCGRSGTTFLQSLVGAHPGLLTFPETNFVGHTVGDHIERVFCKQPTGKIRPLLRTLRVKLGYSTRKPQQLMAATLTALGLPDSRNPFRPGPVKINHAIKEWAKTLDQLAEDSAKITWLEKTPMHVGYIDEISRNIPNAKFIHIIRSPEAVVASMMDAAQKYDEWKAYNDLDYCIRVWNRSVEFTHKHVEKENHFIIHYDDLVTHTESHLESIFRFCNLPYVAFDKINSARKTTSKQVSLKEEPWKTKVGGDVKNINKAEALLGPQRIETIKNKSVTIPPSTWLKQQEKF